MVSFSDHRIRAIAFALSLAILPACSPSGTDTKTTGGTETGGTPAPTAPAPAGSCAGDQLFELVGAGSMDDPCVFNPIVLRDSHCQLLRIDAEASGATATPPSVVFDKDGVSIDRTANPTSGGWTATTTHQACSSGPGCADGTYTVRLTQPENPRLCSEYGSVSLRLVLR